WTRGPASNPERITLTQRTLYPHKPQTELEIATERPATFAVHLRIPAWAGPGTTVAVNGKRVAGGVEPGRFLAVQREWRNGDRVEVEFNIPTGLHVVDSQHPNLLAPVHGPLALFSVGAIPAGLRRADLIAMKQVSAGSTDWQAKTATGTLALRPFTAIRDERYRLYLELPTERS
ncbi:MAG: hypothetical protein ACRD5L_05620, partial [Bryobacteraceae bacterium]